MLRGDSLQVFLFFIAVSIGFLVPALKITENTRRVLLAAAALSVLLAFLAPTATGWWPWLAGVSSALAASPVSWFVVVAFVALFFALRAAPASVHPPGTIRRVTVAAIDDGEEELEDDQLSLDEGRARNPRTGRQYDAEERAQMRKAMREIKAIIFPLGNTQNELSRNWPQFEMDFESDNAMAVIEERFRATQITLANAKQTIETQFINGQDDGDEVHAVIGNRDALAACVAALGDCLSLLETTVGKRAELARLAGPPAHKLKDATNALGAWISDTLSNIEKRRSELED